jgi:uncharacterized protein (TIGR04255 family)
MGTAGVYDSATPYRKPPIVEAAISVEYETLPTEFLSKIRKYSANLKMEYPEQNPRYKHEAILQFGNTVGYSSQQQEDGVVCASSDRKRVVQFSLSSVIISRLAPYGTWEDFEKQARPLWERFYKTVPIKPRRPLENVPPVATSNCTSPG